MCANISWVKKRNQKQFSIFFERPLFSSAVVIVADHMMIINPTDAQVAKLARAVPPPPTASSQSASDGGNVQDQMIQKLSQLTGMNIEYSKLFVVYFFFELNNFLFIRLFSSCLTDNGWNYDRALQNFQDLQKTVRLTTTKTIFQ